jgi:hypothetical protein
MTDYGYQWKLRCVGDEYLHHNMLDWLGCGKHGIILKVLIPESVWDLAE